MIQSYYGNGKGKTTATIGAAVRCTGCGNRVLFVQFLKNNHSAECKVMDALEQIDILVSNEYYELYDNQNEALTTKFTDAYTKLLFEETENVIENYQMIVLDEVLDAVAFGYIEENALIQFLKKWKQNKEILLTGHCLPQKIADVSDYISEVKEVRHPYKLGMPSRKGIEY